MILENVVYEFIIDIWGKILVVFLEFVLCDEVLVWVKKVVDVFCYKDYKVILLIYLYLVWIGKVIESENYKVIFVNYGKVIWDKLVYLVKNICMVICGYECEIVDYKDNVSFWIDKNVLGKNVF